MSKDFKLSDYAPSAGPPRNPGIPNAYLVLEMDCASCGPVRKTARQDDIINPKEVCVCGAVREVHHVGYAQQSIPTWTRIHEPKTGMRSRTHDDLFPKTE